MADIEFDVAAGARKRFDDMGDGTHAEVIRAVLGGDSMDENNSSVVPLAAGASFIGVATQNDSPSVMVVCKAGAPGTMYFEISVDGMNWDASIPFKLDGDVGEFHTFEKGPRWYRVRVVNDSAPQTYMRLASYTGTFRHANSPLNARIQQDADAITVRSIDEDSVMRRKVAGEYIVSKFALNADVDAAEDIWNGGGDYTGFPTTSAEEFQVLSSDAADTIDGTGARTVRFFYLDADYNMFDASGDFLYFDVTLNGTTPVNSGVVGMRIWRGLVITSGSGQTNAGALTARWRTTTAVVFAVLPAGFAQTELGNFTIPSGYTGYLKAYDCTMDDNTTNSARMALKVRSFGSNTFRLLRPFAISTAKDFQRHLYGAERFDEKTDFIPRCTSVTNANGIISFSYALRLTKN